MLDDFDDVRRKAKVGDAHAQYLLGNACRLRGDVLNAISWLSKAADKGHAKAANNLGVLYAKGVGMLQDESKAVHWYKHGAELGDAVAQWNLGQCYFSGAGTSKDKIAAYMWLTIAIRN